jgi:trimethylamine--corrinoid protein Co-methyltransferase
MATYTDKNLYGYALGRVRMRDAIEIARIARGISAEQLLREPSLFTVVNSNSPLQYDGPMLEGVIEMARHNQPIVITPFTLAGAMAPITVAGALVQQNAEALAGIAFAQCVNPGCPVMYGGFTSNVDMRTGAPAFGTPEYAKATLIGGQLARRYRLPYRASNVTASNAPDAQAAYESEMSIWPCVLAHCNLVKHGLGWLEGGLCASYEKLILDAEMLQMMAAFLEPLETDDDALAIEAIREVGPGSHFFQATHTLARYERAFYTPLLSDWRNFETWTDDGALDATMRANRIWKALLAEYQPPPIDPAVAEELDAFVARRKEEGGAPG